MQSFDCNGIWWLPEDPSKRVAGTLRFSADKGVDLSLAGAFADYPTTLKKKEVPIILGQIWDCSLGNVLTLKGCLLKGSHFGSHTIAREDYLAEFLFIGLHLENEDDFLFSKISVQFSGLPSWANSLSGLSHRIVPSEKTRRGLEILWQAPESLTGPIPGGHLTLGVAAILSTDRRQESIKEEVKVSISCEQPASHRDLNTRFVYPLENFLTLATDTPNALVEFNLTRPGSQDEVQVLGSRTFHDVDAATDLVPYSMLFSLSDVQEQAVDLISKWIEISHRLENVCNLYFGVQYKPESFLDTRFMLVCQSLELYQRKRQPAGAGHHGPADLVFGEELARLLEEHRIAVGPLFGSEMGPAISELTKHRNYVIYRDSMVGSESEYGAKLFWITQKLMFLMKACLLTELGIPSERQLKFFQNNQMYAHLLGLVGD